MKANKWEDTVIKNDDCPVCNGRGKVLNEKARVIGYTLTDGETIDEEFVPCPLCQRITAQAEISFKAGQDSRGG